MAEELIRKVRFYEKIYLCLKKARDIIRWLVKGIYKPERDKDYVAEFLKQLDELFEDTDE